jgi:hypothetical protein
MPPEQSQDTDPFSQIAQHLKDANNVLVTVKANPSVDALAACIGLTLALNKLGKHASAVFSGEVPSTIEFLEPEKTFEKNTDSLRDFIISLDKSKADKLRYKVEDQVVKIFITPYRTSITDEDLEFSQGNFNVDAVVAIGVHERNDLDQVIVSHGRILHDAVVISLNTDGNSDIGVINWFDGEASSLSEMAADLVGALGKDLLDSQIATALLTGVVAETDRFRNEKSKPHTMSVSGTLMAAGASTQLVASKLEEPVEPPKEIPTVAENDGKTNDDGMIEIAHEVEDQVDDSEQDDRSQVDDIIKEQEEARDQARRDAEARETSSDEDKDKTKSPSMILDPPKWQGQFTATSMPEDQQYNPITDPLSTKQVGDTISRPKEPTPALPSPEPEPLEPPMPELPSEPKPEEPNNTDAPDQTLTDLENAVSRTQAVDNQTLDEIEHTVNSPHLQAIEEPSEEPAPDPAPASSETSLASVEFSEPLEGATLPLEEPPAANVPPPPEPDYARDAVARAVNSTESYTPEPDQDIGASVPFEIDHDGNIVKNSTSDNDSNNTSTSPPPPPVPPPLPPQ